MKCRSLCTYTCGEKPCTAGKNDLDFHQWRQILPRKERKFDAELATAVNANVGNCRSLIASVTYSANMSAELAVCQKNDLCERPSLFLTMGSDTQTFWWYMNYTDDQTLFFHEYGADRGSDELIQRLCIISSQPRVCKSPPTEIPLQSWNTSPRSGISRRMWQILKVATGPRLAQFRPGGYPFFLFSVIILLA